jgi:DNA invertase Pin-like site-specific DNA recombinase
MMGAIHQVERELRAERRRLAAHRLEQAGKPEADLEPTWRN